MKTIPTDQAGELASQVSKMHNNKELWFYRRTHALVTTCNLIGFVCAAVGTYGHYNRQEYIAAAVGFALFIFLGIAFLQEGIYYTIELPKTHSKKLFKIGDVYFAGANKREAHLYAHINDLDDEIECISTNCNSF